MAQTVDMTGNNQNTSFGGGGSQGAMADSGNLYRDVQGTSVNPGTLSADKIMAIYTLPASSFDSFGKGINIMAAGTFVTSANSKTTKIILNPTTPVLGATVSGGTTIATQTWTTSATGTGWQLTANIFKYGVVGSNTQLTIHEAAQAGVNVGALSAPTTLTLTESSPITIVVTCSVATTATDLGYSFMQVQGYN